MPIDIVKFDRGMTNAYFDNGKGQAGYGAAMGMIQKLKLEIVSEGIEEKEQFAKLDELGIVTFRAIISQNREMLLSYFIHRK